MFSILVVGYYDKIARRRIIFAGSKKLEQQHKQKEIFRLHDLYTFYLLIKFFH